MNGIIQTQNIRYSSDFLTHKKLGWQFVVLVIIPLLLTSLFTSQITNILLQPNAATRLNLLNIVDLYFSKPACFFLLLLLFMKIQRQVVLDHKLHIILITWFVLTAGRSFQNMSVVGGINMLRYLGEASFFVIGYYLATIEDPKIVFKILKRTFYSSFLLTLIFFVYMNVSGRFIHAIILNIDFLRPQDVYSLIHSTELSNIVTQILIIGGVLAICSEDISESKAGVLHWLIVSILFLFICYLFSVATIGILVIFFLFGVTKIRIVFLAPLVLVVVIISYFVLPDYFPFLQDLLEFKKNDHVREYTYAKLASLIASNPIEGVGLGKSNEIIGYYPHQNLLGSWAEGGITWFLSYLGIILFNLYYGILVLRSPNIPKQKLPLLFIAIFSLLFWHIKGLVEDTWINFELLLWSGVLYGFVDLNILNKLLRKPCN